MENFDFLIPFSFLFFFFLYWHKWTSLPFRVTIGELENPMIPGLQGMMGQMRTTS